MEKAAAPTAARQTMPPPSKLQGLRMQQKDPSWMDEIQNLQFQSPVCEADDYCSSNSSSPSRKEVCMSKSKAEFSKTVVMLAMNDRHNHSGKGDGQHERPPRKTH